MFRGDLKRLMKQHGFNNQQEVFQNLLRNVIAADFEAAARMLKCVTKPFVVTGKVSQLILVASLKSLDEDPPDAEDEIERPV